MTTLDELRRAPNALARHYGRFDVANRLLLTGHSHQAWPDVALHGQIEAFTDAAAAWTASGTGRSRRPTGCAPVSVPCWTIRTPTSRSPAPPTTSSSAFCPVWTCRGGRGS